MKNPMLQDRFQQLMQAYTSDSSYIRECWAELEQLHTQSSRHYHNLQHLENLLAELTFVEDQVEQLDDLLFTLFYHDAIYNVRKSDNEHQSALVFQQRIAKTSFTAIDRVMHYIEATKTHQLSESSDLNYFLDMDRSILGKSPETYQTYTQQIRQEYRIYPMILYRQGRKKVLRHFLDMEWIYHTDFFREQHEQAARRNLQQELERL